MCQPFVLLIPEEQFIVELAEFLMSRVQTPGDGKWREVRLAFDIRCEPHAQQPGIGGFLLGGSNAG